MKLKKTKGFSILAIILVIVAVVVAIGVWSLSGSTNTSNSATSSSDIIAASIINDGLKYKLANDSLMIQGVTTNQVIFQVGISSPNNILDPVNGVSWTQISPKALIDSTYPNGYWVYNRIGFFGKGVGLTFTSDPSIILSGLSDQVCRSINKSLYATNTIPTYNDSDFAINSDTDKTDPFSANRLYLINTPLSINGWTSGCLNHNGNANENYYFQVLQAR